MSNGSGNGNNGNGGQMVRVPQPGTVARQEFGAQQIEVRAETVSTALAAQMKANVEARAIMAMQRPRDHFVVRDKLLKECERPGFAEKAIYHKPIGKDGIEGPSIRLAEAAARCMGNLDITSLTIFDDRYRRQIAVVVTDLESNVKYDASVSIEKTVERRQLRQGQAAVGQRYNSYGDPVFIVEATDDDLLNKQNALVSKALRTLILRLLPGDILDAAIAQCYATMEKKDAADPEAGKKAMCDAFASMGIGTDLLAVYLGHPIAQTTPHELTKMRALYTTIKDGEITWASALEAQQERQRVAAEEAAPPASTAPAAGPAPAQQQGAPPAAGKPSGKPSLADVTNKSKAQRTRSEAPATPPPDQPGPPPVDAGAGDWNIADKEPGTDG